ncbi:YbaK/EbsC family protein [Leeia sp. TBRC 13508]|uniref:YbaK/EbsC family protein n=1 Tax=Leeia speluncae TaxID=2884804 RepID=A0ABS8D4G4_9NEIS|nr:YbaK/EbsC family protein [Leeia speluncae]MCB6183064.1 YbaK/EbsC family protein [Leeia speluncae]
MSLDSVKQFFQLKAPHIEVMELPVSSATVEMAANALSVEPARIAKTLALRLADELVLLVTRGDARLDNKKYKAFFGEKARMLPLEEVESLTSHPIGGVCPFGVPTGLRICCDVSMQVFETVFPAAGAINAAVKIRPDDMVDLTAAEWVDVCSVPT